ncbi:hypothetical protein LCGC14_0258560 [marine sediment metagenome]|uniref:Uncharacterized protein n=1 Tax=marine sediment metagenome TaxID=412755 RepID=A0A0F9WMR8_9ZZZZ
MLVILPLAVLVAYHYGHSTGYRRREKHPAPKVTKSNA